MAKFTFKQIDEVIDGPGYIGSPDFSIPKAFGAFTVLNKAITPRIQQEWFDAITEEEHGWVSVVCGPHIEQLRLFAYCIGAHFARNKNKVQWTRVNGARWFPRKEDKYRHFHVLDSFLTFPSQTTDKAAITYDVVRAGNIFDMISHVRGKSSVMVLCPNLTPEQACFHLTVKADFMFQLSDKKADTREL